MSDKRSVPLNDQIIINRKNVSSLHGGYMDLEKRISQQGTNIQQLERAIAQLRTELTQCRQQLVVAQALASQGR